MDTIFRQPGKTGIENYKNMDLLIENKNHINKIASNRNKHMKFNSIIFCLCAGMCSTSMVKSMNLDMRFNTLKGVDFDDNGIYEYSPSYSHYINIDEPEFSNYNQNSNDSLKKEWRKHVLTMKKLGVQRAQNLNEDRPPSIDRINDILDEEMHELQYMIDLLREKCPKSPEVMNPELINADNPYTKLSHYCIKRPKKTCCVIL